LFGYSFSRSPLIAAALVPALAVWLLDIAAILCSGEIRILHQAALFTISNATSSEGQ
jgi:hypothetical protein